MAETVPFSVLLVESNQGLARSLQILIEDEAACEVRVVHSAAEAVAELQRTGSADLVVSDAATALSSVSSPHSPSGCSSGAHDTTLLEVMRSQYPDATVLLMTAHRAVLASVEQTGLVNTRVLLKPVDPGALLSWVKAASAGR